MVSHKQPDMFELVPLIKNIDIKLSAGCESGVKQILSLVTSDNDVVLYYTFGELPPVLKRIPWFSDSVKIIQALCFDPTATWLLVVCSDCSLYIVPALSLVDKKLHIDCKWSLNDITHFPRHPQTPQALPTSVIWWQTLDSNQNALVGFDNGSIVLISLTDGRCIGFCSISEAVKGFCLCHDSRSDVVSLLINGAGGQQWRLVLEHKSAGYLWPPELANQSDDSTRSRLHILKQLSVDKFFLLKQRLSEAGRGRRDSQTSDSASESSHSESVHSGPEMLPHLCDTVFSPQFAKDRHLISAFYKPTNLLTLHCADMESAPLFVCKLIKKTDLVLLTDKVIYVVNENRNTISILNTHFTECRLEGDMEFNNEALLTQFHFDDGAIQQIYKITDNSTPVNRVSRRAVDVTFPKSIEECTINKPAIDTCFIVTTNSVYKINVSYSPILKFMHCVLDDNDLETAEKLAEMFDLKMSPLFEQCGDILLANGNFHSGIMLYKQAKLHLLRRVLKVAVKADCKTLLKFIHLCLNASKVDMSVPTKIHIGNLGVMAYTELLLRFSGQQRVTNTKDFMNFLCCEEYYDQVLAVNVSCQAGHWNIMTLLAKSRGLQLEVVSALGQILQSTRAPGPNDQQFLYVLSEPSLTQSLLVSSQSSQAIFNFIKNNVETFPTVILRRLVVQLDPSQPSALPLISGLFRSTKYSSSLDTTIESVDLDNPDKSVVVVKEFIDTFLCVMICLTSRIDRIKFDLNLLHEVEPPEQVDEEQVLKKFPDLRPLSCGFEHTAVIRNFNVYTMGASTSGCLGVGPLLPTSSQPKLVKVLSDLRIKALSVSCGRKHSLLLTDCGVYAWGSNAYGQLGLGVHVVDTPHPQILSTIATVQIVDVVAGQYHSLALTSSGKVYSWGWGIHGQLGHGNCDNEFYPRLLKFSEPVKQIAAGHAHTLILSVEGKIYGFGSNVFGQLEGCQADVSKSSRPLWIVVGPEVFVPVEKISTAYFHNIAVNANQEVYTWGASPQELRIYQSRNNQKQNGFSLKHPDTWKASIHIYSATDNKPVEQVAVGYRHSVVLHNGNILWGKSKDEELCSPRQRQQDILMTQRFLHISCGLDYTMAIDHCGKLMAWGSPSMEQTLLGTTANEENRRLEGKIVVFRNTKRLIKFPNSAQGTSENLPIEVPGLPTMAITFNPSDQKSFLTKIRQPYAILRVENEDISFRVNATSFDHIYDCPKFNFGQKTLHYALEAYYGFYDFENILAKCLDMQNYQAAAKIAMLDSHYGDSLGFQLRAFKKHLETLDLPPISKENCGVEIVIKNMQEDQNEKNLTFAANIQSPAHILSSSSSLDSIRQWGDDVEHQGGCESPCDMGDVRHNVTQYVQSLRNESENNSPPISVITEVAPEKKTKTAKQEPVQLKDKNVIEAIETASAIVEFYIKKIYTSENHILMQNVLMKCIEFWLANYLPVSVLESVLLKNMDKYFYPLSVLLFCKDFGDSGDNTPEKPTPGFLKEFSTKFCLQLCSMVLDNVNKS